MTVPTHLAEGCRINQIEVTLHQFGKGRLATVGHVALKQFIVAGGHVTNVTTAASKTAQKSFSVPSSFLGRDLRAAVERRGVSVGRPVEEKRRARSDNPGNDEAVEAEPGQTPNGDLAWS